jgi:cephalosporin hydroxylase
MSTFDDERNARINSSSQNTGLLDTGAAFMRETIEAKYSYNFDWLGRPIIQYPQDIVAMQQIIWSVKPDLILETGIAHGGSVIFSASMLELNAACGGPREAKVLAVDIDIRAHNRAAIEAHPLFRRIEMIQGSSIDPAIVKQVRQRASSFSRVLVCLDSNHTHKHVLEELEAYASLTSVGSYCVVFDTIIERMPAAIFSDRPWAPGDNPRTAVDSFLAVHPEFQVDRFIDSQLIISVSPGGYLKRVR